MWRPERPPAASIDALLKGTREPTVEDVLRIFGQADFRNEDDVRAGIRAAADSPASVSYIHLAWSGQSELHKRDFAQFVLSKKRGNMAVPVNFHFIDCTPITEDYSALYDLPGWDRKKYGPQGWGEVLWIRNGRVVHFDRIDRFATTDELVARTKALFGADDTDEAPPRPDSKPGSNLKPLDRNRPEHRRAVAAPEEQSPDHPPQAQPLVKMLEAIATGNPAPLKAVFSEPRTKELDPEEDWSDVLKALQQQARVFYGTTKLDLKGFQYEYIGDDKSGRVVFTYRGRLKDSIEVVTQDGKWEISGPTKGFN